ncbi:SCO family protein [Haloplanus sp. GCM10025708]|uniref:SCO family protein n=1 Tax=Haloferacaceae TaxID=1644056 RepID=UPI003606468D
MRTRRTYLRTAGTAGLAAVGGCLGGGDPNTTLGKPDRRDGVTSGDLSYPAWGEQIPDVTLPDPIAGREVSLRDVDRPAFVTFFYSNCMSVCPRLISTLREVQIHSIQNGYADDVAFYPVSFDPERDTAGRLRTYAEQMNVDRQVGNWHFLRPDGRDRAKAVLEGELGFAFRRTQPESGDEYMFTHIGLVLLVNADGYVERAYRGREPSEERFVQDLKTVRTGGGLL